MMRALLQISSSSLLIKVLAHCRQCTVNEIISLYQEPKICQLQWEEKKKSGLDQPKLTQLLETSGQSCPSYRLFIKPEEVVPSMGTLFSLFQGTLSKQRYSIWNIAQLGKVFGLSCRVLGYCAERTLFLTKAKFLWFTKAEEKKISLK